jgi:hypothetical protein
MRTDQDIKEAIQAVNKAIVQSSLQVPPSLFVCLPTIREALIELLARRQVSQLREG